MTSQPSVAAQCLGDAHAPAVRAGVLLANVGSPDAPTPPALRRYLAQFLSDPRIIDYPRWLWQPILHGVVLRTRPRRSARLYQRIWTEAGSPLLRTLAAQATGLRASLTRRLGTIGPVVGAARYGEPSVAQAMRELRRAGVSRVLIFPLYPQYSTTTTASVLDAVAAEVTPWRRRLDLRVVTRYGEHPAYLDALAASVRAFWTKHGRGRRLLISFHGIPDRYIRQGDPYRAECITTAERLAARLGLSDGAWAISFQSRFGPEPWLEPYTDQTLAAWGRAGLEQVDVVCPGFSADCLETLDEIGHEGARQFREAGGGQLRYIPALNAAPAHLEALAEIAAEALRDERSAVERADGAEQTATGWRQQTVSARANGIGVFG